MRIKPHSQNKPDENSKSKEAHHHHKGKKDFKLPQKEKGEAQAQLSSQQQSQQIAGDVSAGEVKGQAIQASKQVDNVKQAILKMVDSMRIGQMEGKSLLNAKLKTDATIHQALRGAEVRLEMTEEGLKVHIEPIAGQKDMAQSLIAEHHDQVVKLQAALAAKNIHLHHMQVGDHVVELPHDKILSPNELFSGQQMDQGTREGRQQEGPPERIDPTEKS